MEVKQTYSHKKGESFIKQRHSKELDEVFQAISTTDAVWCLRKITKEKTKPPLLFSPIALNTQIKGFLAKRGWVKLDANSKKGFREPRVVFGKGRFGEMEAIKNKVGVEIQLGKYAFMGYDIFSKMPIFAKKGLIECGIEVVVVQDMVRNMSTGISSFDQIVLDMKNRGEADVDLPTLVLGISPTDQEVEGCEAKRKRFQTNRESMLANGEVSSGRKGESPGPKGSLFDYNEKDES